MNNYLCLYIDFKKAVGLRQDGGRLDFFVIESELPPRLNTPDGGISDKERQKFLLKFFRKIVKYLKAANVVYLIGTYPAKWHFESFLSSKQDLVRRIVANETTAELDEQQVQKKISRLVRR